MKKKILRITIKILIIAAILIPLAFLLKDSSDQLLGSRYNASAPTQDKFARLVRWLPSDADLVVVADVQKFFSEPGFAAKMKSKLESAGSVWGVDSEVFQSLMSESSGIGLVALALKIGSNGQPPAGIAVVQGNLNEKELLKRIKKHLQEEDEQLEWDERSAMKTYVESAKGADFAFAFPDPNHMILGPKDLLNAMTKEGALSSDKMASWNSISTDSPLFGRALITDRTAKLLPEQLAGISKATFSAGLDLVVKIAIPCTSQEQAMDLDLFVEGAKVSLMFADESKSKWTDVLKQVDVKSVGDQVSLSIPLNALW